MAAPPSGRRLPKPRTEAQREALAAQVAARVAAPSADQKAKINEMRATHRAGLDDRPIDRPSASNPESSPSPTPSSDTRSVPDGQQRMTRLPCLTPFLESGKRFRLPSGETFSQLRQPPADSTASAASTSPGNPMLPSSTPKTT